MVLATAVIIFAVTGEITTFTISWNLGHILTGGALVGAIVLLVLQWSKLTA